MEPEYDYVIVGGGGAGCVLANRLSADPATRVLLVEAGGSPVHPMVRVPKGFFYLLRGGTYAYCYDTLPAGPNGAREQWLRGKALGGSTSINGMQYDRGGPWFWNELERLGNVGWGWDEMSRVFREIEDHEYGATPTRGAGGPMRITVSRTPDELTSMLFAAGESAGLTRVPDVNEPGVDERIGFVPNMSRGGFRESSATAFLRPARRRRNLTVVTNTPVGYVLFDGTRAAGVRLRHKGRLRDVKARREVILSAGAIESPQLLERSGVGSADVLGRNKVKLIVESPNVGERIREQRQSIYQAKLSADLGYNSKLRSVSGQIWEGAKYLRTRRGIIAAGAYELVAFFKSSPDATHADLTAFITPMSLDRSSATLRVAPHPGFTISGQLLHPTTESSVHITSVDADAAPVIEPHYLETDYDRMASPRLVEFARRVASQSSLAGFVSAEESPGDDFVTDEQLIAASWRDLHVYHGTGSAGMGTAATDVVDPELRVRGTESLRVVDASVFPLQPGNTAGPTVAMAWRAADKILAD